MEENEEGASKRPSKEPTQMPSGALASAKRSGFPLWSKVLVMCALVFVGVISYYKTHYYEHAPNGEDIQQGNSEVPSVEKRKSVPDIVLVAGSGPNRKLSDYKGKVVLLSFWASWCTPCLLELPTFIDLHQRLSDKGLVILPVNVDEPNVAASFVGDYWKTKKFPFPTFYDPEHASSEKFNIDSLPSNFVLDKQGRQVAEGYGANDWSNETSIQFIEQLLSE